MSEIVAKIKLAVFVNPKSGSKSAVNRWFRKIKPFLMNSGEVDIVFELITKEKGEAEREAAKVQGGLPEGLDGVLTLGGDGFIGEVINGLYKSGKLSALPVYPLLCGTGNGLVNSLFHRKRMKPDQDTILRAILSRKTQEVDLFKVEAGERLKRIAFLSVTIGILADTDIDSEKLRCLGNMRFTLCGLWKIARNRGYRARVIFGEKTLDSTFVSITAFNLSHASPSFMAAPERTPQDGLLSLACVGMPGRRETLKVMMRAEKGLHISENVWNPIAVKNFHIELEQGQKRDAGIVVDGEVWDSDHIRGEISPDKLITYLI